MSFWKQFTSLFSSPRTGNTETSAAVSKRSDKHRMRSSALEKGTERWVVRVILDVASSRRHDTLFFRFDKREKTVFAYSSVCGSPGCRDHHFGALACPSWKLFRGIFERAAGPSGDQREAFKDSDVRIWWDTPQDGSIRLFFRPMETKITSSFDDGEAFCEGCPCCIDH